MEFRVGKYHRVRILKKFVSRERGGLRLERPRRTKSDDRWVRVLLQQPRLEVGPPGLELGPEPRDEEGEQAEADDGEGDFESQEDTA